MTIIEREKWRCADCGAEDYYFELMSSNGFWGVPEDPANYGPPKVCPRCGSTDVIAKRRIFVPIAMRLDA